MLARKRVSPDCFDDAGNVIAGCMDRLNQEEDDWQHMKNQQRKPATSTNGHSDEEHERGVNPRIPSTNRLDPLNPPLDQSEYYDYVSWKYRDTDARRGLFRGKHDPESVRRKRDRDDFDDGVVA